MSLVKTLYYKLLNVVTFGKGVKRRINGFDLRFPARWSRYYPADYENENYAFLKSFVKPGMHVVDIGAHIGLFSAVSSQLVGASGKVVSFEPTPGTYKILSETLRLSGCENVNAVQAAVSEKPGHATFYISSIEGCNSNSLVNNKENEELNKFDVELVTIDSLRSKYNVKPDLIKIDAEGAELDVLKGGTQLLSTSKPALILGLHPSFIQTKGDSLDQIWDFLQQMKYEVQLNGKAIGREEFCSKELIFDVNCL